MRPKTALGRTLAGNPEAAMQLLADFDLGSLEGAVLEGPILPRMKSQRLFVAIRGATGRLTTFSIDVPIEDDAEAGTRVYRDVRDPA